MNLLFIATVFAILINSLFTYGQKYEEPSLLSQVENEELNDAERCDLDEQVEQILNLMLTFDATNQDVQSMVDNKFTELEAYVKHLKNIFKFAVYGPSYMLNDDLSKLKYHTLIRTKYFLLRIKEKILETLYETCTLSFRDKIHYYYDNVTKKFSVLKNTTVNSKQCLCDTGYESCRSKIVSSKINKKSFDYLDVPDRKSKNIKRYPSSKLKKILVVKHDIIPRSIILEFVKILLSSTVFDANSDGKNAFFDICSEMVNTRFVHSLEKLLAYESTQVRFPIEGVKMRYQNLVEYNFEFFLEEIYKKWAEGTGGNTFVGPLNRGPLNPSSQSVKDFYGSFQYGSMPIIGQERYFEMLSLNNQLWDYVVKANETNILDRLVKGAELLVTLLTTIERYAEIPMDPEKWEERELISEESSQLNKETIDEWKGKKFWAIKQPSDEYLEIFSISSKNRTCHSLDGLAQRKWTEFILGIIETSLIDSQMDRIKSWSCDWARIYYGYRFVPLPGDSFQCSKMTLDTYLYSKISRTQEWYECTHFLVNPVPDWCQAWRRIMLNSDIGSTKLESVDNGFNKTRLKKFHQDTETLIRWISESIEKPIASEFFPQPSDVPKLICYAHTNITSKACPNDCSVPDTDNNSQELKKITSLNEAWSLFYEREWYVDDNGKYECQCKGPTLSYWQWFKQILGYSCREGPTTSDSLRCEGYLRR